MFSLARYCRTAAVVCTASVIAIFATACDRGEEVLSPSQNFAGDGGNSPVVEQAADLLPLHGLTDADVDGMAKLKRAVDGLSVRIKASGDDIKEGDAFTFWAIAFNNPDACESDPCSLGDLFNVATGGTVLNFGGGYDGAAEDEEENGELEMDEGGGELARLSTEGVQVLFPGEDAPPGLNKGIKNPYRVEVLVVLRNHGMKEDDPDDRAEQTSMVGAHCNLGTDPGDRDVSDPFRDGCADQGIAIFLPPDAPGQSN